MPTKNFPDNFPTTTNIFLFSSFFGLLPFEEIERENEVDDDGDKEEEGEEKGPCPLLLLPLWQSERRRIPDELESGKFGFAGTREGFTNYSKNSKVCTFPKHQLSYFPRNLILISVLSMCYYWAILRPHLEDREGEKNEEMRTKDVFIHNVKRKEKYSRNLVVLGGGIEGGRKKRLGTTCHKRTNVFFHSS